MSRADTLPPLSRRLDNMSSHQLVTYCHSATLHERAQIQQREFYFSPLRTAASQQKWQTKYGVDRVE